ncbi:hypothetical protein I0P70_16650 [Pontibacter sp. FD36]|uniref:hypothetical protein n=1 Tax=Pontibacter sp. FD36 TaxID=2789860 RepID=UPI0018AC5493|nr:hypothetical protein [Pontibacter sp. FD36]MBF8964880.1 hypothetical protein [Pontibacter sp. FD36]
MSKYESVLGIGMGADMEGRMIPHHQQVEKGKHRLWRWQKRKTAIGYTCSELPLYVLHNNKE